MHRFQCEKNINFVIYIFLQLRQFKYYQSCCESLRKNGKILFGNTSKQLNICYIKKNNFHQQES